MTTNGSEITSSLNDDYTSYDEYLASRALWKGIPPFLLIFGTIGNVMSIIVLTRKNIRKSSCSVYLVVLACSDLVVLYTGLFRQWILATFEVDIRHFGSGVCKLHIWLVYVSLDLSSWILAAVTIERVALVWFPHSAKSKFTKRTAVNSIVAIVFVLFALNGHMLYGFGDVTKNNSTVVEKCTFVDNAYQTFFETEWPWIDFVSFCGLPFFILFFGNILIISKVVSSRRAIHRQVAAQSHSKGQNGVSSMSVMLFTVNTVFLFCNTPISAYLIAYEEWYRNASAEKTAMLGLVWSIVNILMYTNNTMNFIFYCLSGSRFRNEVIILYHTFTGRRRNLPSRFGMNHTYTRRSNIDVNSAAESDKEGRHNGVESRARNNYCAEGPYTISESNPVELNQYENDDTKQNGCAPKENFLTVPVAFTHKSIRVKPSTASENWSNTIQVDCDSVFSGPDNVQDISIPNFNTSTI